MRKLLFTAAALVMLAVLGIALVMVRMNHFLDADIDIRKETGFEIEAGASFAAVAARLEERDIISNADFLRLYARWAGQAGSVQAGEYLLRPGTTPRQLLQQFVNGEVRLYSFTIVEGWNHWELLAALHRHAEIEATLGDEDWPSFLAELGAGTTHPEGLFLPETYRFPANSSDRSVLASAYKLLQTVLAEEWEARSEAVAVSSPYEALILASIIEKETAREDERARISGVFTRRLQSGMRLQTDPTVIYGIGREFNGNLTRRDLQTATPYNTYTISGLPPTPIAMAGQAAIHAALHPAEGEELFFVATGLGDGSHQFSTTREEHEQAVAEYLKRLRSQRAGEP